MTRRSGPGNEDAGAADEPIGRPVAVPGPAQGPDRPFADLGPDDAALVREVASVRAEQAAAARARKRWLTEQATETTTLAAAVWDLVERRSTAVVATLAGRHLGGTVVGAGRDFLSLSLAGNGLTEGAGWLTLVPFWAIVELRPAGGLVAGSGRDHTDDDDALDFREALATLAPDRPQLAAVPLHGGEIVRGELRSVGADVAVLAVGPNAREISYLRLSSVAELSVMVSG